MSREFFVPQELIILDQLEGYYHKEPENLHQLAGDALELLADVPRGPLQYSRAAETSIASFVTTRESSDGRAITYMHKKRGGRSEITLTEGDRRVKLTAGSYESSVSVYKRDTGSATNTFVRTGDPLIGRKS